MSITPLETRYAGCRFRSRLEARWAVFFDHLGIKWEYEPQGYVVEPNKRPYLPDFRLPELDAFVEVKGDSEQLDTRLLAEFTRSNNRRELFTLVLGQVPAAKLDRVPTHALFMPSFDFPTGEPSRVPIINKAFAALEKLEGDERAAVEDLIDHDSRMQVTCHQAFFIGFKGKWSLVPINIPNFMWDPKQILNPGNFWPVPPQPKLRAAYEAARSARFEHGEQG